MLFYYRNPYVTHVLVKTTASLICRLLCSVPTSRYSPTSRHGVVSLRMDNAKSSGNSLFASTVDVSQPDHRAAEWALNSLFITHHKLSTDGLSVLLRFIQLNKGVHLQYFYKACHGKNCSQSGAKKILHQQCCVKQQYTE